MPKAAPAKKIKKNSNKGSGQSKRDSLKAEKLARGDYGDQRGRSEQEILEIGRELVEWAYEGIDDVKLRRLSLRRFFFDKNYTIETAEQRWCKKYPEFNECYQKAKQMIGIARESGMLLRELDTSVGMRSLHYWLPEYLKIKDEDDERKIKIEKEKQKSSREEFKADTEYHGLLSKAKNETKDIS